MLRLRSSDAVLVHFKLRTKFSSKDDLLLDVPHQGEGEIHDESDEGETEGGVEGEDWGAYRETGGNVGEPC